MKNRITKQFSFEAAHQLTGLATGHKCSRLHGHSYRVEVVLEGEPDARGFVVDYSDLAPFGEFLDEKFDHYFINDVVDFQTSAENLAKYFYEWCKARWPQVVAVRVSETQKTWAEYRESDSTR